MADALVEELVRTLHSLVVADTQGRARLTRDVLPELLAGDEVERANEERLLHRLALNRDIPARLAPSREAIRRQADGLASQPAYDERPEIRAVLTRVVARAAGTLDPDRPVPPAGDLDGRRRFGAAVYNAYAELARQRLEPQLFPNGREDDLGIVPVPDETGDAVAARALVLGIGARTGQNENDVLKELVRAGRDCAAQAAARMLLGRNRDFTRLPSHEQREAVVRATAQRLETGFATERPLPEIENVLAYTMQERAFAADWGARVVDRASEYGNEQVADLRRLFDQYPSLGQPQAGAETAPAQPGPPTERPASVEELLQRVDGVVREVTGADDSLWTGEVRPFTTLDEPYRVGVNDFGAILLHPDLAAVPLRGLTQAETGEPNRLDPEQAQAARAALQELIAAQARLSVPAGTTLAGETRAQDDSPEYHVVNLGSADAFAAAYLEPITRRALPAELADQVLAAEPQPHSDPELALATQWFARVIDNVKGMGTDPSETLRRMAGQDHRGAGTAVGELLVANSRIPRAFRPAAVRMIGKTVVSGFDELPEQVADAARWSSPEDPAELARRFGDDLGRQVHELLRAVENNPTLANRDDPGMALTPQPVRLDRPAERPADTRELLQRIQGTVAELTGAPDSLVTDQAVDHFAGYADPALVQALADPSETPTPEQLTALRDGIYVASGWYADQAVPAGHTPQDVDPRREQFARSVRDAFVDNNADEVVDRVLPPELAEQVKAVEPSPQNTATAPAALALAESIDGHPQRTLAPSDTLRHLAGQSRDGMSAAAADLLVQWTEIPAEEQPAVVRDAAERIDHAFAILPAQIDAWRQSGVDGPELEAKVSGYGREVALDVYTLVDEREDVARQDSGAQADRSLRFVPNRDPAAGEFTTVTAPVGKSSAPTVVSDQSKERGTGTGERS